MVKDSQFWNIMDFNREIQINKTPILSVREFTQTRETGCSIFTNTVDKEGEYKIFKNRAKLST